MKPIKKLVEDISKAAYKGIENLWSEFLEIGDLEAFLAESEQFIFDVGMDEMIDLVLNESE